MAKFNDDILLDENDDLSFKNGDFAFGDAHQQHAYLILATQQGEWKQNPLIGSNLIDEVNGDLNQINLGKSRAQLESDGFIINLLEINEKGFDIDIER